MAMGAQTGTISGSPPPGEREISVWTLPTDIMAAADGPRLSAVLDEGERARANAFRLEDDRLSYCLAHGLLRRALSALSPGIPPSAWRFERGPHGKPHIAGPIETDLAFSLSHTRGLVAIALARGLSLGVDVEADTRDVNGVEIATRFFSRDEANALRALPAETCPRAFLALWTLKEAIVKASGRGLTQDLSSFTVELDRPPRIACHDPSLADASRWRLWHARTGRHHLALAAIDADPGHWTIVHRRLAGWDSPVH